MNLYNIPLLNGYKTLLGGYGLLILGIAGLLVTGADFLTAIGECLTGTLTIQQCIEQSQVTLLALYASFQGLTGVGLGHKLEKSKKVFESKPVSPS